jgi:hypothetical protein
MEIAAAEKAEAPSPFVRRTQHGVQAAESSPDQACELCLVKSERTETSFSAFGQAIGVRKLYFVRFARALARNAATRLLVAGIRPVSSASNSK